MSIQTPVTPVITQQNVEDILLAILPILAGPTGTALINLTGLVPGVPGFILAVIIASLAKSAIGISQNRKSYEDWLNFLITFLGLVAAGFSSNGQLATIGLVLGFIAKALPSLAQGINIEDILLLIGSVLAGLGTLIPGSQGMAVTNLGLLVATIGKAWPSIASNGLSGLAPPPTPPKPGP